MPTAPPSTKSAATRTWIWVVAGAAVGFGITYGLYVWLNPVLEARTDWLRELQGFLFTSIPLGTLVGALLGRRWARRQT